MIWRADTYSERVPIEGVSRLKIPEVIILLLD